MNILTIMKLAASEGSSAEREVLRAEREEQFSPGVPDAGAEGFSAPALAHEGDREGHQLNTRQEKQSKK